MLNSCGTQAATTSGVKGNMLVYAVAWKQTAAEYRALYHQAYNIARMRLDTALAAKGAKPAGDHHRH
jgi:predicted secreted acid phosphatase